MNNPTKPLSGSPEYTAVTQADVLAEAAAKMAATAAAKASDARARAAEALARAIAIRAAAGKATAEDARKAAEKAAQARTQAEALTPHVPPPDTAPTPDKATAIPSLSAQAAPASPRGEPGPVDPFHSQQPTRRRVEAGQQATPGRVTYGRRATDLTDNSGIIRLGHAVRGKVSEQVADRRAIRHSAPVRTPGALLEPEAHAAGLGVPHARKRRFISPGLVFLLLLMALFGLYASGHLPQFDRLTNSALQKSQAHSADVAAAVTGHWQTLAWCGAAVCVILIVLLIINTLRARAHERLQ